MTIASSAVAWSGIDGPILFSGAMVRAILENRKTNTRRLRNLDAINANPGAWYFCALNGRGNAVFTQDEKTYTEVKNPYGDSGDRLWVRETWQYYGGDEYIYQKCRQSVAYKATWETDKLAWQDSTSEPHALDYWPEKWRPSIFLPRWASRLTLEIVKVRVERVQDISEADALAEGVEPFQMTEQDLADLLISDESPGVPKCSGVRSTPSAMTANSAGTKTRGCG